MNRTLQTILLLSCSVLAVIVLPATGNAQTPSNTKFLYVPYFPKYKILGVVYAPPGSSSFVSYSDSSLVGSSHGMTSAESTTNVTTTSSTSGFSLNFGLFSFGSTNTSTNSDGWTTSNATTNSVSIQTTQGNGISTMGPISSSLGVNHDNDVIYIWLNPVVTTQATCYSGVQNCSPIGNGVTPTLGLTWTGLFSNTCDPYDPADVQNFYQLMRGCDSNQYPNPDIVGIPVWCLKNPYWPGQSCAQWLPYTTRPWDRSTWVNPTPGPMPGSLGLQDYADILQADPFVALNGNAVNVCHPVYGPNFDPNLPETVAAPITLSGTQVNYAGSPYPLFPQTSYLGGTYTGCGHTGNGFNRFQPYGTVEYPVPGPNGLPSTYTGFFNYSQTNSFVQNAVDSHTTSYSDNSNLSFGIGFSIGIPGTGMALSGGLNAGFGNGTSDSQTWTQENNTGTTTGSTSQAQYSITGPQLSDNYTGPPTFDVYLDNVYKTFTFYSPLSAPIKLGTIGVGPSSLTFGSVTANAITPSSSNPGNYSAAQTVTLTNNSNYPLTIIWPAVTFTDPGFRISNDILQDGSDLCSNQVVPASGTCTVKVLFAPTLSDAPNTISSTGTPPGYTVSGTMIAAGTETASGYQNVLVVAENSVSATALVSSTTQGATLKPATLPSASGWNDPADQNVYLFPKTSFAAEVEQFTFKNYYSSNVVFPAYPQDMVLSDTQNFTVLNGTAVINGVSGNYPDGCSGATVSPGGTCTLTVQFLPTTSPPTWNYPTTTGSNVVNQLFGTKVTAMGAVPAGTTNAPLTYAGAAGTAGTLTLNGGGCFINLSTGSSCSFSGSTITNNSSSTVSFTYTGSGTNGFSIANGSCSNIAPAGTCSVSGSFTYEGQCTPPPNGGTCGVTGTVSITATFTSPSGINGVQTTSSGPAGGSVAQCTSTCSGVPPGFVVVGVSGTEQSRQTTTPGTPATTQLTVSRVGHNSSANLGLVTINIGNFRTRALYRGRVTQDVVAKIVANALSVAKSPVTAHVVGNVITVTSKSAGSAQNFAYTVTSSSWGRCGTQTFTRTKAGARARFQGRMFCEPSRGGSGAFAVSPAEGSLSGGADGGSVAQFDSGTINAAVGGASVSSTWGQSDTPQTIAASLALSLNGAGGGQFTATSSGNTVTITPVGKAATAPQVQVNVTDGMGFSPASFSAAVN